MKNEKNFFKNLFIIFVSISVLFSIFVFKTGFEFSFFVLFFSVLVYLFYHLAISSFFKDWNKKRVKILKIPLLLFIYFILGLLFAFRLFYHNLNIQDEWFRVSGYSLSFHLFIAILASIISYYFRLKKTSSQ